MEMAKFENRFLTPIQGFTQSKIEKAKNWFNLGGKKLYKKKKKQHFATAKTTFFRYISFIHLKVIFLC